MPDLAGWRRERMPYVPDDHRFEVVPDWVCEILSPSTESKDRRIKMPLYARYGVPHLWLVDPIRRNLDAYVLDGAKWTMVTSVSANEQAAIPPFDAIQLDLTALWE